MNGRTSRFLAIALAVSGICLFVGAGVAHAAGGAPELDPGSAASGLALLVGGAMLIIERHRKR